MKYRWIENGELTIEGDLNIERGFGDNMDATVYVLDWKKERSAQRNIVLTGEDPYKMYDGDLNPIAGYAFEKVE